MNPFIKRLCKVCGVEKLQSEFSSCKRGDPKQWCLECRRAYQKRVAASGLGTLECSICKIAKPFSEFHVNKNRTNGIDNRCRTCKNEGGAWRVAKMRYGIGKTEILELELKQGGLCASCGERPEVYKNRRRALVVDHNHETGEIRGLVCGQCNSALGLVLEDPQRLLRLLAYLCQHNELSFQGVLRSALGKEEG